MLQSVDSPITFDVVFASKFIIQTQNIKDMFKYNTLNLNEIN